MLAEELEQLNIQIEQARRKHDGLEGELRAVEAELETFSADRQRFAALRDACNALEKLKELKADELFWGDISGAPNIAGYMEGARSRLAAFEAEIGGILEKQTSLHQQIVQCLDELDILDDDVRSAYDREERRQSEYVVEREISSVPYREMVMPWSGETESERRFRRYVSLALLLCLFLSTTIVLIKLPVLKSPPLVVVPERMVSLVKKVPPRPVKARKVEPKQAREAPEQAKKEPKPPPDQQVPEIPPELAAGGGAPAAREKAETAGVLKFKEAFRDMMKETPVAKLGTEARLSDESPRVKGQAVAQRSLVAMQAAGGSSGGIGNAGLSRNIGYGNGGRLGGGGIGSGGGSGGGSGPGFVRVASAIANLEESSRPTSDGMASGRTDEEIQIVFDRYKASLYRIYNVELRKDPTLRGKMLMRISIEPSGAVSLCRLESTDLASAELVARILERIKKFNFGPKDGVQKVTILYPIDFLPAG
ncbi:MAG: AgmX/PglI C-terminal domain-containing protein [Deltaproteobacteria bacterium]